MRKNPGGISEASIRGRKAARIGRRSLTGGSE